jgi:hypothetical protein
MLLRRSLDKVLSAFFQLINASGTGQIDGENWNSHSSPDICFVDLIFSNAGP